MPATTGQDLKEAISEHQHLIKVLRSRSRDDDRQEAKKQAAELKALRRKAVPAGLPTKPAPEAYPGVELGDSLYVHHPERGPIAVKVHAQGKHGITATDSEGHWHRVKWPHVLGAKQRLSQRLTLVEQGEEGAIIEDDEGQRRYLAIDPEAQAEQPEKPLRKALFTVAEAKAAARRQPTPAQIDAGNYPKLHGRFQGLRISIENPKGSTRRGTDPNGKPWQITMHHHYGYIRGSQGVDKDHVDCYIGPHRDADTAYIVHQRKAGQWDQYDEDKVMLGFHSEAAARRAYLAHYDDPRFLGPITAMPMAEFKQKVLATAARPRMIKGLVLFFKTHIDGFTNAHGTFVAPHEDKREPTKKDQPGYHPGQRPKEKNHWMTATLGQRLGLFNLSPVFIVEASNNRFQNLTDAQAFVLKQFGREPALNNDTGWEISFGHKNLSKLFSASSTRNSIMPEHIQIVSMLRELIKNAVLAESHIDRKDTGESGQANVLAIHRLYAPIQIDHRLFRVKLTVKEHSHPPGLNFKNYQLAEIEMPAGELVNEATQRITPTSGHPAQNQSERVLSIADLLRGATRDSDHQPFTP